MNLIHDTQFRRKTLFLLGNTALIVAMLLLVVMPVQAVFDDRDEHILEKRKTLGRVTGIGSQLANVKAAASETAEQIGSGEFLSGSNENVISAELQTRLKSIIGAAGAHSKAIQATPIKVSDRIRYSGARIEI